MKGIQSRNSPLGRRLVKYTTLISLATIVALLMAGVAIAQHAGDTDSLETRALKPLMVTLGQDMNRISDGLWHDDFRMIRIGAQAIAEHPRVPPEQMAAIKAALGKGFEQFVGFDQQVHQTAVELARAAEHGNLGDLLDAHQRLQRGCISCHSAFREEVREALY